MLRLIGVGAGNEHPEGGDVRERGPHLLPVDHPLVAVAYGARGQSRHVGPGAGLAEELAPDLAILRHRREVPELLLLGSPVHDRGPGHPDPDDVERPRRAEPRELFVDDLRLPRLDAGPAVLARPGRRRPSRLTDADAELGIVELLPQRAKPFVVAGLDRVEPTTRERLHQPFVDAGAQLVVTQRRQVLENGHGFDATEGRAPPRRWRRPRRARSRTARPADRVLRRDRWR